MNHPVTIDSSISLAWLNFTKNIRVGTILPRWAPDLGEGRGQLLFVFTPPLIYYLAEFWYLVGSDLGKAFDYASVVIVFCRSSMFLLCRWLFGTSGGLIRAVVYVYSPYFTVDLFVRRALEEFSAFALCPVILYLPAVPRAQ